MNIENYIDKKYLEYLKEDIGEKRFLHSLGVVDEAIKLAKIHDVEIEKAVIAALLHDCGKFRNREDAKNFIDKYKIEIDEKYYKNYQLLHPILGVDVARIKYKIDDEDILSAIRLHTTLKENPSTLEKIIYIADAIEEGRKYEGIEELRELTYKNLGEAILKSLEVTIIELIGKGKYIGVESLEARNYFLEKLDN